MPPQPHKQPPILSRDSNPGLVDLLWRSQVLKPSTAHAYASLSYIISSNPIVLARPLSILGVLAQQLPSTLKYINDNFDPNSNNIDVTGTLPKPRFQEDSAPGTRNLKLQCEPAALHAKLLLLFG